MNGIRILPMQSLSEGLRRALPLWGQSARSIESCEGGAFARSALANGSRETDHD